MNPKFPLSDVILRNVEKPRKVEAPAYISNLWQINQRQFAMQVEGVGNFYACCGKEVEYAPVQDADPDWVNLYLSGQILVALLHQRKIINFHASSFIHHGHGIMLLGETGAGKSSLTAAFTINGATFLSDDLTPMIFRDGKPFVLPVNKTIKLREDTINQLRIGQGRLQEAEKGTGKYFFDVDKSNMADYPLQSIVKIEIGETPVPASYEPDPAEKFSLLRSEICSWEMLAGMHETEKAYLKQLITIVAQAKIARVVRPLEMDINELFRFVEGLIEKMGKWKSEKVRR